MKLPMKLPMKLKGRLKLERTSTSLKRKTSQRLDNHLQVIRHLGTEKRSSGFQSSVAKGAGDVLHLKGLRSLPPFLEESADVTK